MNQKTMLVLTAGLLLTACGNATDPQGSARTAKLASQSLTASSGTSLRTYQADINTTTVLSTPGLSPQTVSSTIKAAYLFVGGQVKTRIDLPSSRFPDQRARIAVYDTASAQARVVFGDTLSPDTSMNTSQLVTLLQPQLNVSTTTQGAMQAQSTPTFKSLMASKSIPTTDTTVTINGISTPVTQAVINLSNPNGGSQQNTINFDPQVGMVVQASTQLSNAEARQNTTTNYSYVDVSNLPGIKVPTRIQTSGTLISLYTGNTVTISQVTDFQNPELNTLPDSHFTVGGL